MKAGLKRLEGEDELGGEAALLWRISAPDATLGLAVTSTKSRRSGRRQRGCDFCEKDSMHPAMKRGYLLDDCHASFQRQRGVANGNSLRPKPEGALAGWQSTMPLVYADADDVG